MSKGLNQQLESESRFNIDNCTEIVFLLQENKVIQPKPAADSANVPFGSYKLCDCCETSCK